MKRAKLAEIQHLDEARRLAMLHADLAELTRLCAEEMTWIHSSSRIEDKASFLEGFRSGRLRCFNLEQRQMSVRFHGEVAQVTGIVDMEVAVDGRRKKSSNVFSSLWVRRTGEFQLVHWQSTRMPDA